MRDPMTWSLFLYRLFGIAVRLHVLYPVIALGLFVRLYTDSKGSVSGGDLFFLVVAAPFLIILLHEYGHCFAARSVGGHADQILMWPLGGLAFVNVPETPRANFITTLCGPLVNLALCGACSLMFLAGGFSPLASLNPFSNPFTAATYNFRNDRTYTSEYGSRYYKIGTSEAVNAGSVIATSDGNLVTKDVFPPERVERALAPAWAVWTYRVSWLSWWLFLFNMLIPAYPMDCGRLLHAILWARTDARTATVTGSYVGYGAAAIMLVISLATNEAFLMGLAFFIIYECYRVLHSELSSESTAFGYDFSQGYTSLEKNDSAKPPLRRPGLFKRWLLARKVRRLKEEHESQAADEARMDELLEKIARQGKHSLSEEERRFMERVSARYRNRSS